MYLPCTPPPPRTYTHSQAHAHTHNISHSRPPPQPSLSLSLSLCNLCIKSCSILKKALIFKGVPKWALAIIIDKFVTPHKSKLTWGNQAPDWWPQKGKKYNPSFLRRALDDSSLSEDDSDGPTLDGVHSTKDGAGIISAEKTSSDLISKLMGMSRNGTTFVSDFQVERLVTAHMTERHHAHEHHSPGRPSMTSQMASMAKSIDALKRAVLLGRPGGARSLLHQDHLHTIPPLPLRSPDPFAHHLVVDDVTSDDSEAV